MLALGHRRNFFLFFAVSCPLILRGQNSPGPIALTVDATEINRQLLHAQLSLPVNPGPLTLAYPKWIPGEHAPTGPIDSLVGLKLSAGGQSLAWHRDPVELYLIRCDVPTGVAQLDISLDYVVPMETEGYSGGRSSTAGTPADTAKLAPGMKIVAVNSRTYNAERLEEAIKDSVHAGRVDLLVNSSDYFEISDLTYAGGLRFPHLERDPAKPDLLSEILKARAR
jgi:hypothetical protein